VDALQGTGYFGGGPSLGRPPKYGIPAPSPPPFAAAEGQCPSPSLWVRLGSQRSRCQLRLQSDPTNRKYGGICKGLFHNLCQTNTIVTRQNYGYSILGSKFLCRCSCWQHVIARRWSTRPVDRVRAASQAACAGIRNPDHPPSNSSFRGDLPVCSITRVQFGGASVTSIPTATVVPSTTKRHIATLAAAASSLHAVTKAANL